MWSCVRLCVGMDGGQVPLMRVLDSVVAAMDAHRGVANVVEEGLRFLRNLAVAARNQVGGEGFVVAALGGCRVAVGEEHTGLGWAGLGCVGWMCLCVCAERWWQTSSGEWKHVV